jgi:hypothetical protein
VRCTSVHSLHDGDRTHTKGNTQPKTRHRLPGLGRRNVRGIGGDLGDELPHSERDAHRTPLLCSGSSQTAVHAPRFGLRSFPCNEMFTHPSIRSNVIFSDPRHRQGFHSLGCDYGGAGGDVEVVGAVGLWDQIFKTWERVSDPRKLSEFLYVPAPLHSK